METQTGDKVDITTQLYAIRDCVAEVYLPPVTADKDSVMVRNFGDAISSGKTPLSQHPEDYVLVKIGIYHTETGYVESISPVVLAHASDFVKPVEAK